MALSQQLWNLVGDFLEPKQFAVVKLTCVAAGLSQLRLPEQLLLWTTETVALRAANARIAGLERRLVAALHRENMRRLREIEDIGDPTSDDEFSMCEVCGRRFNGLSTVYFLARGDTLCEVCFTAAVSYQHLTLPTTHSVSSSVGAVS